MSSNYRSLSGTIRDMKSSTTSHVPLLDGVEWRYSRLCSTIRNVYEQKATIEKHERDQLAVGTYKTKNFEQSPEAQLLYNKLPKDTNPAPAEKSATLQDKLFALEKEVLARQAATPEDVKTAEVLADQIMRFADEMGMTKQHSYIQNHLSKIKHYASKNTPTTVDSDEEVQKILKTKFNSPPYDRKPDPKKDMDLDSKEWLIRRNLAAQRKIKIIDGD